MSLPDTINVSYVPGTVIDSQTLNDLQKWTAEQWAINRGAALEFYEDFYGTTLDTSKWSSNANITFPDESANGGAGAGQLSSAGAWANSSIRPNPMALGGTGDVAFATRVRAPSLGSGVSTGTFLGLASINNTAGITSNWLMLVYYPGIAAMNNGHWYLWYGNGNLTGAPSYPSMVDLGVGPGASYQKFEVFRTAGVITVNLNGAQVANVSPSPYSLDGYAPYWDVDRSAGTITVLVDYFKLWARTAR